MNVDNHSLVSVIIPCYRQAHFLPEVLSSVLSQQAGDLDVIVVDDGSPDDVRGACARFGSAVKVIRQENRGLSEARNTGLSAAQGIYVHCLDADDWIGPDFHGPMIRELEAHPNWAAAVCKSIRTRDSGSETGLSLEPPDTCCPINALRRKNLFPVGAVVFRRNLIEQVGTFDAALRSCEDWDFWLRVARTGAVFGRVAGPVFFYRTHAAGMSHNALGMFEATSEVIRRARVADPRITGSTSQTSSSATTDELDEYLGLAASGCIGKALAGGDAVAVEKLFEKLLGFCREHPRAEHYEAMLNEASLGLCASGPTDPCVWNACWSVLAEVHRILPENSPARVAFPELVRGLSGVLVAERERDRWRANYERLAGSFPVRKMLWLRRRVLGIADTTEEHAP